MTDRGYDGICAYMVGVWGRELSNVQRAAGWKILNPLPDAAVEKAIDAIVTDGREHMPPWPLVYKAAEALATSMRQREDTYQLPAGDSLSDQEHQAAMIRLRAKQTAEQRRRADRVTSETQGMSMQVRLRVAQELLTGGNASLAPELWNRLADEALAREFQLLQPLLSQGQDIHA